MGYASTGTFFYVYFKKYLVYSFSQATLNPVSCKG